MIERLQQFEDWARACMHVRCGFCRENCPAYSQLKLDSYAAKGKVTMLYHILKGTLEPNDTVADRVFACTNCGLCDVACGYDQSEAIQQMKIALRSYGVNIPEGYDKISRTTRAAGNPYSADVNEGSRYLQSIPESRIESAEYTLFLGCTQIYRDREDINHLLRILRASETSFNVLAEPICCGSPAYRVGDESQARTQAEKVRELIARTGSTNILISCAGCFRMLTNDYPNLLDGPTEFKTVHATELLQKLVLQESLDFAPLDVTLTYHDPCHLGRHSEIYEEPRQILKSIPGVNLVEMEWNRKFAKCCGAGGGFRSGRGQNAIAIAASRVREAEATGATILVTSCPFCLRNLRDGANSIESTLEVVSIEALLSRSLDKGKLPLGTGAT